MWINKAAICNPRMSVRFFSCATGSYLVPTKLSGRITLFFLSLTSLFLYTSYSANIVALQQSPSSALSSLSDLVHSPLAVGIQDLEYNRVYFKVHPLDSIFTEWDGWTRTIMMGSWTSRGTRIRWLKVTVGCTIGLIANGGRYPLLNQDFWSNSKLKSIVICLALWWSRRIVGLIVLYLIILNLNSGGGCRNLEDNYFSHLSISFRDLICLYVKASTIKACRVTQPLMVNSQNI